MFEPPKTLPKLIEVLQQRFKDLDDELKQYEGLIRHHESNLMQILSIAYVDSDNEENAIDESVNLHNAYRYAEKRQSNRILKLIVKVNEPRNFSLFDPNNRASRASSIVAPQNS